MAQGLSPAAASAVSEAAAGRGKKLPLAVKQELSARQPSSPNQPESSQPESAGWSLPLPDLSSISLPGNSTAEKALVVLGILLLGLMLFGRVTGKPIFLGLAGPSAGNPRPLNPSSVGGAIAPAASMAQRIAAVNPAKVA